MMPGDSPLALRVLHAGDQAPFVDQTFPAMRHLLERLHEPTVLAVGAVDAEGAAAGLALGLLGAAEGGRKPVQLLSLFVRPSGRGAGWGEALLSAFCGRCRALGASEVHGTYMTGQASTASLESLLARAGWTPPETRMLVIQATLESTRAAPWMKPFRLPDQMEIVRWLDLTEADRAGIRESQAAQPWIPPDLYPFDHEADCEPLTSLALKSHGQVVGWVINHRVGDVLRFTCSFVHRRLQRLGRVLLLYNEAATRMPGTGLETWMCTVPVWHPAMASFAQRLMAPYASRFLETRGSRLQLAQDFENPSGV